MFKQTLPGNVHPSGLIVVAGLFLAGYWIFTHHNPIESAYTTADIGYGGGIKPEGWQGDAYQWDDSGQDAEKYLRAANQSQAVRSRNPAAHQPEVLQGGAKIPWYKFIDQMRYSQRNQPYLEKRSYP